MNIQRLTVEKIIENIQNRKHFEATTPDDAFIVKITRYVPYCCTAIHNGSKLRPSLQKKIIHSDYQRWYEEDPLTGDFISSMPITIIGLDSRFEYDLNRKPEECIYTEAWGKSVWKKPLSSQEEKESRKKHASYYKVLHALIEKLEALYQGCVVYDLHSYNHKRLNRKVPLFNIGTELVNREAFENIIKHWMKQLNEIILPDIENETKENDVFFGRGYNLEYITTNFENTLVLATEIKKVFCDELTGDVYPEIVKQLHQQLKKAILNNANYFGSEYTCWQHSSTLKLLDKILEPDLIAIDESLYYLLRNFELLAAVNPINTTKERRRFIKSRFTEAPEFKYYPVKVNAYNLKQKLLSLPLHRIHDISIRSLYESVISSFTDKIDLISTLDSKKFLYNSLRYFGRPSKRDLTNASYLMLLPDIPGEAQKEPLFNSLQAMEIFKESLADYEIDARVELSNKVISKILVLNSKRSILFQPEAMFRQSELNALIEHEIGIHMVTTANSNLQKLKIFNIGLPVNTRTQEGLALLAEYLSGNLTLQRMKRIAHRVIIVDMMCSGADFIECFHVLTNEYKTEPTEAFNMVTRVFRGGGYTKDYLYMSGFVKILRLWEENTDLTPLLVGKTSTHFYGTIEEMMGREMITPPKYITKSFLTPKNQKKSSIYNYIFSGLK
jgi:uncharacterized protein (TIGR02421 family)